MSVLGLLLEYQSALTLYRDPPVVDHYGLAPDLAARREAAVLVHELALHKPVEERRFARFWGATETEHSEVSA